MNTKITLNIDNNIIEQAKIYAKSKKISISKLVEEYLYSISINTPKKSDNYKLSPITSELLGMIKQNNNSDLDYNKILEQSLEEKYL